MYGSWAGKMAAEEAKVLSVKSDNLSSVSGTHMMVGQNQLLKLFPHLHSSDCLCAHTHIHTCIRVYTKQSNKCKKKKKGMSLVWILFKDSK